MLDFIINPYSGKKNGKKLRKILIDLENYLSNNKIDYRFHFTLKANHAIELTKAAIDNGATTIISVGGDGTLHEVINGFHSFDKCSLGIIPCGTGNDFASALNLPKDPLKALKLIVEGTPKYTDFMQMPTVRGINIIGMGIDVDVLKKYALLKKKTKWGYTKSLIKTLLNFDYSNYSAVMNGETKEYRSFIACIANGYRYGGGIPICPIANTFDTELDFLAVKEMPKLKIVKAFLKLKKGKIMEIPETIHEKTKEVKIEVPKPYTVQVDGELYENIPFEVKIVSNTLKVYR